MAAKKRPAKRTVKNQKQLMKQAPEELESFWDEETNEAWTALNPKQQKFFVAWLNSNYNRSEAYRKSYNELASDIVAAAAAYRMFNNVHIATLCSKLSECNKFDVFEAKKVYREGMEAIRPIYGKDDQGQPIKIEDMPDHMTRKASADSLMKLNGELIERVEKTVHNTLNINNGLVGDLNQYLTGMGKPPLKQPVKPVQPLTNGVTQPQAPVETFESVGSDDMEIL